MMQRYFAPLLLLLFLAGGCSEDLKPNPPVFSKFLTGETSKTWRIVSFSFSENGGGFQRFNITNDCMSDDLFTFYNDEEKTYEYNPGSFVCRSEDPIPAFTDIWVLENASANLTIAFPPFSGDFRVPFILSSLDERKLTIDWYESRYVYRFVLNPVNE